MVRGGCAWGAGSAPFCDHITRRGKPSSTTTATCYAGAGKMAKVTYIQRLETAGGNSPANGCDATTAGASARVPYTATYFFYAADDACDHGDDRGDRGDD